MTTIQHTPGPWYFEYRSGDSQTNSIRAKTTRALRGSVNIALVCNSVAIGKREFEANCNLIAAAPETAIECAKLKERVADLEQILHWCKDAIETDDALKKAQAHYAIREYSIKRASKAEVAA